MFIRPIPEYVLETLPLFLKLQDKCSRSVQNKRKFYAN